jgi:uncharacterized BrkB/YihY/UPF0761 family membrane protein
MIESSQKRLSNMNRQTPRSRIYIGLFLFILFIVIPYFVAGLFGIVVVLIFAALFAAVRWLVNQLPIRSPTLRLFLTALILIIVIVALFAVFFAFAAMNGPWLPTAD